MGTGGWELVSHFLVRFEMDLYGIPLALAGLPDKQNYKTQTATC